VRLKRLPAVVFKSIPENVIFAIFSRVIEINRFEPLEPQNEARTPTGLGSIFCETHHLFRGPMRKRHPLPNFMARFPW
jgi:hypothetical protein